MTRAEIRREARKSGLKRSVMSWSVELACMYIGMLWRMERGKQ